VGIGAVYSARRSLAGSASTVYEHLRVGKGYEPAFTIDA
jgi:hypothetical protein